MNPSQTYKVKMVGAGIFVLTGLIALGWAETVGLPRAFDDTILYQIGWENTFEQKMQDLVPKPKALIMTTANKERYKCYMPIMEEKKTENTVTYDGPSPLKLLQKLFDQMSCSYKLESYWTYELCHGRFLRQYHEERDGKKGKVQEYFLGKWDKSKLEALEAELAAQKENSKISEVPSTKVEGLSLPYFMINMEDGTVCDLTGKPRVTRVQYVCYPAGKHEMISLEEVSSCEYEVIVLTPYLCQHPDYKIKDTEEHQITCVPLEAAGRKPIALANMETDSSMLRQQAFLDALGISDAGVKVEIRQVDAVGTGEKITQTFYTTADTRPAPEKGSAMKMAKADAIAELNKAKLQPPQPVFDSNMVDEFLRGDYCLHGGSGWWRYEFCYGKRVEQYHEEKDGSRTVIHLGYFNQEKHLAWLEKNPNKRPKPVPERKHVSHMYSDGSQCDLIDGPRRVEVKLKCKESAPSNLGTSLPNAASFNSVSLYLMEPAPCEYILGVEAAFLCPLVKGADENGYMQPSKREDYKKGTLKKPTTDEGVAEPVVV